VADNIISLTKMLSLDEQVERDMRMHNYTPGDPESEDDYWSDLWCENDLGDDEPLKLTLKLGTKTFNVSITKVEERNQDD
tara:strand:+ start:251 stop:490 length:240 start_codon:yes stop_codon:yes gene_type:complete